MYEYLNNRISSLGITASVDYLQRDETVSSNTFVNSSLTTLGTLSNLVATSGNFNNVGGYNSFNPNLSPMVFV